MSAPVGERRQRCAQLLDREGIETFIVRLAKANHLQPAYLRDYLCPPPHHRGKPSWSRLAAATGRHPAALREALEGPATRCAECDAPLPPKGTAGGSPRRAPLANSEPPSPGTAGRMGSGPATAGHSESDAHAGAAGGRLAVPAAPQGVRDGKDEPSAADFYYAMIVRLFGALISSGLFGVRAFSRPDAKTAAVGAR